jgi:hypothetical protein
LLITRSSPREATKPCSDSTSRSSSPYERSVASANRALSPTWSSRDRSPCGVGSAAFEPRRSQGRLRQTRPQAWCFAVIGRAVRPLLKTPAQGADTPIYLAASPDAEGITGQFFVNRKPRAANKVAGERALTARLWQVSADLVGLTRATL